MATQQTGSPHVPADRYGRSRGNTRGVLAAVVVASLLLTGAVGWFAYQSMNEPVRANLHSWDEPSGDVLSATVEIHRQPGLAVTCDLVAVDLRRVIVGQLQLDVPAGPEERLLVSADIPLEGDGVVPRLQGCHTAGE